MSTSFKKCCLFDINSVGQGLSNVDLNAANNYAACVFQAPTTSNITGCTFNVVTKTGANHTLKAQLFGVDGSGNPDNGGSELANGTVSVTAAAVYTITFGTPYTPTAAAYYSIVISNTDGTPASNYSRIAYGMSLSTGGSGSPYSVSATAGSWTKNPAVPLVVPTLASGFVARCLPATSASQDIYNSGSTPDEWAVTFTPPIEFVSTGCYIIARFDSSSSDVDVILYEAGTAIETIRVVAANLSGATSYYAVYVQWSQERTLALSTLYRVAVRPSSANSIRLGWVKYANATDLLTYFGFGYASSRADAGSWTDYNSGSDYRGIQIIPLVNAFTTGGGAGGVIGNNMDGGFA